MAAGQGRRFGGLVRKQYRELMGVPLVLYSVRVFVSHPEVAHVTVVLPPADAVAPPGWLGEITGHHLTLAGGGARRCDSVAAGLDVLPESCRIVLVHDGARPFPERSVIDSVIAHAREGHGAIAAIPISDTIKRAPGDEAEPRVTGTVPREGLWRAQTPQGFPRDLLVSAHRRAADSAAATDDATLLEASGTPVVIVPSSEANLKVTTPDDLVFAEALIRLRDSRRGETVG